ncbi:pentatricopeptide repeat-containing protein At4g19191, mitochondrial [Cynara cardunculus var. scolymus]|uniref:Pentatricopeptide repeat-containing protein n=1 Tax=Cynara cardunculus var. scolymus TaxID=59895 RepID=A0A103TE17_CYNCS|nr:pentatricopeptide repeat-containing protein At4g19191, mitochondrial [Cynara cardunculus var. scolymus]XP_024964076.1 pentatricopeptide repeat-containing protein At4g19191, mitochondrial [Cynara cardunculus var. scolymus]KVH15480.1 Pentatricopeptide repeat-containing protein [Cynara cardunculus var. scolymus]
MPESLALGRNSTTKNNSMHENTLILITMIKSTVSSISYQFTNLSMVRQWNYAIREAVNQDQCQKALFLFSQMMQKSLQPNHLTFPIIAKASGKLNNVRYSKIIHAQIVKSSFSDDIYVQTAMMDMYIKCDCMNIAYEVFSRMSQRDIASWNSLLFGFAQLGVVDEVLSLFKQMRVERIRPDSITLIGLSQSSTSREGVPILKAIHSFGIRIGVAIDVSVSSTWISSYAKVRDLVSAEKVFHGIEPCFVTVVSWNSMIAGYAYFEKSFKAVSFYKKMLYDEFKPDISTNLNLLSSICRPEDIFYGKLIHCHGIKMGCDLDTCVLNTLISMYSKCDDLGSARHVFDNMVYKTCVSWTAMISGYAEKGDLDGALALFHSMDATGVKPDLVTVLSLIAGCGETGALDIGRWVEDYARLNGLRSNMMVLNALIDMYAKCGSIEEACEIFYMMSERTVVSWTSMIAGCALNGEFGEALTHFFHMLELGVKPNHITFLIVLQACNHGGFIEKGWEIYDLMRKVHKLDPELEHYSSMADLFGRGGKLNEAVDFIQNMPMKPDVGIWSSLLSACKIHRNVAIGELAACRLFEMEPRAAAPYVEMANIYASTSCWDGVTAVRRLMKQNQVTKHPGQSTIRVNGKTHKFTVEDRCHHKGPIIYEVLDGLALESKYELDVSNLQDVLP